MKRCCLFLSFFLFFLCVCELSAQRLLKRPLCFAVADSVCFFDGDKTNLTVSALTVDKSLHAQSWDVSSKRQVAKCLSTFSNPLAQCDSLLLLPRDEAYYKLEKLLNLFVSSLAWTGDARYADGIEQLVYNYLLPQTSRPSFEQHQAARLLINTPALAYMTDGSQLYINLFFNGYASISVGKYCLHIDQITHAPFSPDMRFRLTGLNGTTRLTLRVRLPFYHEGNIQLFINGHDESHPVENGYLVIDRYWNNGDELFFALHYSPRLLQLTQNRVARLGALLYRGNTPLKLPLSFSENESNEGHRMLRDSLQTAVLLMDE